MGHFQPTSASARWSGFWLFSAWPSFPWASLKLKQRQLPIQRLTLIFFIEATTDLDIIMEASTVATLTTATTARDLLTLSLLLLLPLMPRPKLTPGTDTMDTDTVLDTTVDTTVDTMDTMATPTPTMARGLLMPRLPLKQRQLPIQRLTLIFFMEATTDTATRTMAAMAMATTGASKKGGDPIES